MVEHIQRMPISLVGQSSAAVALRGEIATAARTQAKVLITGEAGVGKELVSRLIHDSSVRRARPFLTVNCSGMPETTLESKLFGHLKGSFTSAHQDKPGLVNMATEGTLLLNDLDEMSPRMQSVLLRFTDTGAVQPVGASHPTAQSAVRLMTATHRDLASRVKALEFHDVLYYRLNVFQIHVPALRDRGDDVRVLLHHFLAQVGAVRGLPVRALTTEAEERLVKYYWPGNVRELKATVERLVVQAGDAPITVDDLPAELRDRV